MSVLACDRRGCNHVMCHMMLFGNKYYICTHCLAELEKYRTSWTGLMTLNDVTLFIEHFMLTEPGTYSHTEFYDANSEEIEREFRSQIRNTGIQ